MVFPVSVATLLLSFCTKKVGVVDLSGLAPFISFTIVFLLSPLILAVRSGAGIALAFWPFKDVVTKVDIADHANEEEVPKAFIYHSVGAHAETRAHKKNSLLPDDPNEQSAVQSSHRQQPLGETFHVSVHPHRLERSNDKHSAWACAGRKVPGGEC